MNAVSQSGTRGTPTPAPELENAQPPATYIQPATLGIPPPTSAYQAPKFLLPALAVRDDHWSTPLEGEGGEKVQRMMHDLRRAISQ